MRSSSLMVAGYTFWRNLENQEMGRFWDLQVDILARGRFLGSLGVPKKIVL